MQLSSTWLQKLFQWNQIGVEIIKKHTSRREHAHCVSSAKSILSFYVSMAAFAAFVFNLLFDDTKLLLLIPPLHFPRALSDFGCEDKETLKLPTFFSILCDEDTHISCQ